MKKGTRVIYVPSYALCGIASSKAEFGVIKSSCDYDDGFFVIYDQNDIKMITGDEPYTAEKTDSRYLRLINVESVIESWIKIQELAPDWNAVNECQFRLTTIIRENDLLCPEIILAMKLS